MSITRVMPVCNSYNKMFVLWLIVIVSILGFFLYNAPVICNLCPPTYGDGWGIAGLMCGAMTFWVPPQYRVNAGLVIWRKYTPVKFTLIKSRAMTLSRSPQCRAFSRALMDEKSLSPLFPVGYKWLVHNFDNIYLILFIFTPRHYHQTMHVWKENRGWRISITRATPLCNSYSKMFVLWLIVHTLWNQFLVLSLDLFNTLQICYRHIEDVHEEAWCWKKYFLTNLQGF